MIQRRAFLTGSALLAAAPLAFARAAQLDSALEKSGFVYVSPLRSDGSESSCHGEVWFGWLDGAVVINTASARWKARAVRAGLQRARVWVGDHGRWKRALGLGENEAFRRAPHFEARASLSRDTALLDRLLALYQRKYPDEIARWRGPMRSGIADGSRVLVRYTPV